MYMRFVQLMAKSNNIDILRSVYDSMVIPELQNISGCLYAGLMHSKEKSDELISLTMWDTKEHSEAYESTGVYQKLLDHCKPFLEGSTEWKVQLSDKLELEYAPEFEDPVPKQFVVAARIGDIEEVPQQNPHFYLRIVSVKIQKGKIAELRKMYSEEILPALYETKGCHYAYLIESLQEENEVISVTIWDSKQDADNYEKSGQFDQLTDKVKHTFSQFYQWKMELEKQIRGQIKTSEDLLVSHYDVVTGKNFANDNSK
jgi:quinol monooxygenase YgiN